MCTETRFGSNVRFQDSFSPPNAFAKDNLCVQRSSGGEIEYRSATKVLRTGELTFSAHPRVGVERLAKLAPFVDVSVVLRRGGRAVVGEVSGRRRWQGARRRRLLARIVQIVAEKRKRTHVGFGEHVLLNGWEILSHIMPRSLIGFKQAIVGTMVLREEFPLLAHVKVIIRVHVGMSLLSG